MIKALRLIAALAVVSIPAAAYEKPAAKPASVKSGSNWAATYSVTPDGGFRMGNPDAKVALVEYGSLTCPHCKHFADTGGQPLLQNYIRAGKVSYEFRPMILNGIDLAATLVARCGGPSHFFPITAKLYATQDSWASKISNMPEDEKNKLKALPLGQMMAGIAEKGGLVSFAAANGIPAAKAEACLKDDAAASKLARMYQAALDKGVNGTPTFFVNGKRVDAIDWPTLEPFLKGTGT